LYEVSIGVSGRVLKRKMKLEEMESNS
jgi:hypothetical protein